MGPSLGPMGPLGPRGYIRKLPINRPNGGVLVYYISYLKAQMAQMLASERCAREVTCALPLILIWKRHLGACVMMMMMTVVVASLRGPARPPAMQLRLIS